MGRYLQSQASINGCNSLLYLSIQKELCSPILVSCLCLCILILFDSLIRDIGLCYVDIVVVLLVLVILQVPFIALGARVRAHKQGEEEGLLQILGRSFFGILISLRKT